MNMATARITDGGAVIQGYTVPVERSILDQATTGNVLIGVRPEDLHLADEGIEMTVTVVEELGADTFVYGEFTAEDGQTVQFVARDRGFQAPSIGSVVHVRPERIYVFDTQGERPRLH